MSRPWRFIYPLISSGAHTELRSLFWPRRVAENYVNIASKNRQKAAVPAKRNTIGAGLHCQRGLASVAGPSSKPRQPLRKRRKRARDTHNAVARGKKRKGLVRVGAFCGTRASLRKDPPLFYLSPLFFSRCHSKEEDRGTGLLLFHDDEGKGPLLEERGKGTRGMDEDGGFSVLSHEPTTTRSRTIVHKDPPAHGESANMSCAPCGCYMPRVYP